MKRPISNCDRSAWHKKTARLNKGVVLRRGLRVQCVDGWIGVVVKMYDHNPENPIEEHGCVYIWQEEQMEYGGDNCEHYAHSNWQEFLRVIDDDLESFAEVEEYCEEEE